MDNNSNLGSSNIGKEEKHAKMDRMKKLMHAFDTNMKRLKFTLIFFFLTSHASKGLKLAC